ncbi:hypothetical protein OIU77_003766 [Salix suchowensis]|uniref:NB-ARC domain-containing protein n=1 Tax=Salix suchowensis TaxID=1278906 RepID=A0ABQ9AS55_9ROSI|nr:hypothetical protein OIU77_003766 [Salix suchowensis]
MDNIPIGELLTFLWNVIKEPVAYIDYEQNLRALETKMHELMHLKDDLTENVQMAEVRSMRSRSQVTGWYKIGKKIDERLKAVSDHIAKGEKYLSSVPSPVGSVMRCLCESEKSTIGIYGPGGVGKTALLTQDFLKIDGRVKVFQQKARELSSVLSQKKFVLLLDDLWKPVDLAEVGVPSRENGSKLVFTTSSEELCNSMGAEEKIRVGGLAWDKAWKLFQEKVGEDTLNIHPEIPRLAETIAKMCNGLPLALITVGRAMAFRKTLSEWRHSIEALSRATAEFPSTPHQDFVLVKFGYDSLPSDKVRSCFLYCALFPEGFCIKKSDLIDYWIGEGFLGAYSDACEARIEGHTIIDILAQACLLEDEGRDVKMHQVIRDMALWVDSRRERPAYLVKAGTQLADAPEVGKWEVVRKVSLMANNIQNLSKAARNSEISFSTVSESIKDRNKAGSSSAEKLGEAEIAVGDGVQTGGPGSLARDLQCLEHLNLLTITIRNLYSLQTFASFSKFQAATRELSLQQFQHARSLDISLLGGMNGLDELEIIDCINLKDLGISNSSITSETSFHSLRRVSIVNCSALEDLTWLALAPNIRFLRISRCSKMEEIIRQEKSGQRNLKMFEKLECLQLVSLPHLKVIYPDALPFPYLKEIFVDDCPNLRKLPLNSNSAKEHRIVIQGWEDWWRRLEWEDEAAQHTFLPSFKGCL